MISIESDKSAHTLYQEMCGFFMNKSVTSKIGA